MKDIHPLFHKLAGVGGPNMPVLVHQSGLLTAVVVVVERSKIYSLVKRSIMFQPSSITKLLCLVKQTRHGTFEGARMVPDM